MAQGPPEWSEARRQIELREARLVVLINDVLVKGVPVRRSWSGGSEPRF